MNRPERIGVYGGTFDPIHRTHLDIARAAQRHAQLDRVIFMVAARPPHKRDYTVAEPEQRYALVEAALRGEDAMAASRIELEREGPSYTADTLRQLHAQYPGAEFYLIVGLDTLLDLPGWREPETVLSLARLLVVPRADIKKKIAPMLDGKFEYIPFTPSTISSTEVRRRIAEGDHVDQILPDAVANLIRERGLYHAPRKRAAI